MVEVFYIHLYVCSVLVHVCVKHTPVCDFYCGIWEGGVDVHVHVLFGLVASTAKAKRGPVVLDSLHTTCPNACRCLRELGAISAQSMKTRITRQQHSKHGTAGS